MRKQVQASRGSGDGSICHFPANCFERKRQVWVLLIPETVTDEKQHEMAGQLCRSVWHPCQDHRDLGEELFQPKTTAGFWGLFVLVFVFWQLRGNVNQKDKRGTNPDYYNQLFFFPNASLHSILQTVEGCGISQLCHLLAV